MKILVTGSSGFIGFHTSLELLNRGYEVFGIDSENDYYDVNLKAERRKILLSHYSNNFTFHQVDLADQKSVEVIHSINPKYIIHLAAQAGVRHSLEFPHDYTRNNIIAFTNILEFSKSSKFLKHLVFASTSSVYGANTKMPFSEDDSVDHPLQYYAVTKRTNELMAHSYSHLYNLPTTGLRFFTVYGPWGRPDMALFKFTKSILAGENIQVYNYGNHQRDFTYIDDIVEGIIRVLDKPAQPNEQWDSNNPDSASSMAPWRIYNIGNNSPVELNQYIEAIEKAVGIKAIKELLPLQPGDVPNTYANVDDLVKDFNYKPTMSVKKGVENFIKWYKSYYDNINQ